ncbi:MAG: InlB B-repeat-containing protein [Bacilli bacterium]|jgi:uncharacterized repeat protein (TIGR02543 family)
MKGSSRKRQNKSFFPFYAVFVSLVLVGLVLIGRHNIGLAVGLDEPSYTLTLNSANIPSGLSYDEFLDTTGQNRYVEFDYVNAKKADGYHASVDVGGFLGNRENTPITSMKSMTVTFEGGEGTLYVGASIPLLNYYATITSGEVINFTTNPYFFSLINYGSSALMITSVVINYSCSPYYSTINYETNGGSEITATTLPIGDEVFAPDSPFKDGYSFVGWFSDAALTTPYSFTYMPESSITVYAKWSANTYYVSYYEVLNDISELETGVFHSLATTQRGLVFSWGYNNSGQLGDNTHTNKDTPLDITSRFVIDESDRIISFGVGQYHSLALSEAGRVFAWGGNNNGQLGTNSYNEETTPREISGKFSLSSGDKIVSLRAGTNHSLALTLFGRVFAWGYNGAGQLGNNSKTESLIPVEITSNFALATEEHVLDLKAGYEHSLALTSLGKIFAWGSSSYGQLGINSTGEALVPTEIASFLSLNAGETISLISAGYYHSLALTSQERVLAWGYNSSGQLGDNTTANKLTAIDITDQFALQSGDHVVAIEGGFNHSIATTYNKRVYSWGDNEQGQLGDNTLTDSLTPTEITARLGLSGDETIDTLSLGNLHSAVLTSAGLVKTWGYNVYGQLGDATKTLKRTPTLIAFANYDLLLSEGYPYESSIAGYIPERSGYSFSGWYYDASLTNPYVATTMPSYDLSLFGKFAIL